MREAVIPQQSNRPILVGTNFLFRGELVVVVSSNLDSVLVRSVRSEEEEILSALEARNLIRQYILGT
jgi:hypothetical protein